jgi:hypothetical protein
MYAGKPFSAYLFLQISIFSKILTPKMRRLCAKGPKFKGKQRSRMRRLCAKARQDCRESSRELRLTASRFLYLIAQTLRVKSGKQIREARIKFGKLRTNPVSKFGKLRTNSVSSAHLPLPTKKADRFPDRPSKPPSRSIPHLIRSASQPASTARGTRSGRQMR